MCRAIAVFLLLIFSSIAWATEVLGVRYWQAPDKTRLVFDSSGPVKPKVFTLDNPRRLVIDLPQVRLKSAIPQPKKKLRFLRRVRAGKPRSGVLRLVLDLKTEVKPKVFPLAPNAHYGHRLVVDLFAKTTAGSQPKAKAKVVKKNPIEKARFREVVVAIDAGHGGEDAGAIGRRGTREKDVVLAVARKLAKLINEKKGMKAVLIRDGDYYIGLRKRMELARKAKADLFVSIHADAFRHARARGASVFTLSERGASSEFARWVARRENQSDLVGGIKLQKKDETLARVLLDLSQTATREASQQIAREILEELKKVGKVHSRKVQQAGFMVLKSPDIPSVLVETAFITNPQEERNLRSSKHQWFLAKAIFHGILDYFAQEAPTGTILAEERRHVIARGETLSGIAHRYGVSMKRLMSYNALPHTRIRPGQVLRIPLEG
ncbi:MAG: N-acetylmuramoyl-L-alanine amidase [Methylothermaceae bacteria B42]|nr:MAG: N-acetylmuramoyl-L-alanine amidase [Methylothermaceae bacteria B42]HHJ39602.1 AMIN domain-containing protein [Methylothermaceae bacterium]